MTDFAVTNTIVADNQASGIWIHPSGTGTVNATLNRVELYHNDIDGLAVEDTLFTGALLSGMFVAVDESVAAGNGSVGFEVVAPASHGPAFLDVIRSVSANNTKAFVSGVSGVLRVGQSEIFGNAVTCSGQVGSYGDNYVSENLDSNPPAPLGVTGRI